MLKVSPIVLSIFFCQNLYAQDENKPVAQFRKLLEASGKFTDLHFSGNNQHIAYCLESGEQSEIYIIGLREKEPTQITTSTYKESKPVWSPDVKKIAYQKDSIGISSIWVYSFEDGQHKRITPMKENAFNPSWAPNNQALVFSTDTYGSVDVIVREFNSTKSRRLTAAKGDEFSFGFQSKGQYVGYYERNTDTEDVYAVAFTGKEAIPITRSLVLEHQPTWSYNGSRILFYTENNSIQRIQTADFPYGELNFVIDISSEIEPIISPDGKWIIYEDETNGKPELFIIDIASKKPSSLGLSRLINKSELTWAPGGTIIAITSYFPEENKGEIWLVSISDFVSRR
ncbi:MAG: hypothetical protein O2887_16395 [Bacteroidetes bacterium]|nr:hypothetical protein [Bacteroidota bacterium]MDA1122044.1 hypothetical protein [Bacteroidota bacterium]